MENNKQTAVEWLMTQLPLGLKITIAEKLEQAKEMEKQQIINAFQAGDGDAYNIDTTKDWAEQYYNERYGNKS